MLSPFAPLYPWLKYPLAGDTVSNNMGIPIVVGMGHDRDIMIDLRDSQTRVIVLRALADAGHARPWALGSIWSPLTDEQAGRVTAEIVRAVGADPSKPAGVVPSCVLGAWRQGGTIHRRHIHTGDVFRCATVNYAGWYLKGILRGTSPNGCHAEGSETGEPGRLAADTAARALGCIMIEDITP